MSSVSCCFKTKDLTWKGLSLFFVFEYLSSSSLIFFLQIWPFYLLLVKMGLTHLRNNVVNLIETFQSTIKIVKMYVFKFVGGNSCNHRPNIRYSHWLMIILVVIERHLFEIRHLWFKDVYESVWFLIASIPNLMTKHRRKYKYWI